MEHHQANWGRPRDDVYGAYDHRYHMAGEPVTHTTQPTVTGSSVIGIKFRDGVIIAADNLASYGSLRRFTDIKRVVKVADTTAIGFGGDVSDMQELEEVLDKLVVTNAYDDAGEKLEAPNVHAYLRNLMYQRRSKMDPLWNAMLIGGFKNDTPFLAYLDLLGVTYQSPSLGTGMGSHLAVPILRKLCDVEGDEKNVSEAQARQAIDDAMKVLFYRDARAMDKYSVAIVTKDGVRIEHDVPVTNMSWRLAADIRGFGTDP